MRIAHLILAHKNPPQLERLIRTLHHEDADVYIHLDGKVDDRTFVYLARQERVYLIKNRVRVFWGGYSIVKAIVNSMEEILQTGAPYDFINLMSAQDYPIKSADYIHTYLSERKNVCFISYSQPDEAIWWEKAVFRIRSYHFTDYRFRGSYRAESAVSRLLPKRQFPLPMPLYGSNHATWWTLTSDCARYVVKFIRTNKKLTRFARFTWGADEFLIPTIVMSSPFKDQVVNDNLRYIDWSEGGDSPKNLRMTDFDALLQSEKLIARKVDTAIDAELLDRLDKHVHQRSGV